MNWLLFQRFAWRHWRRSWKETALLVAILALGVGVFLSIRLANRAAVTGFTLFTESLTGESDLILRHPGGGEMPVSVLRKVRELLGALPVAVFPVVEATVAEAGPEEDAFNARPLQIIGADLVALQNAVYLQPPSSPESRAVAPAGTDELRLGQADRVFIPETYAERRALAAGDALDVLVNDRRETLTVAGILRNDPLRVQVPENLLLMDLPGAQLLLGQAGKISRVELRVPPGAESGSVRQIMRQILGGAAQSWVVETPEDRRASAAAMTGAFRLNLTILSTLALLVGTYLILQAMEAAVVRRRTEIAILRSLGVGARSIRRAWLVESLAVGLAGSVAGVALGAAAAQAAVGNIARTVNSLYYQTTTRAASLDPGEVLLAIGFGLGASLLAGWLPARDASETPPAQSLKQGARAPGLRFLGRWRLGMACLAASAGLALLPPLGMGEGGHAKIPAAGYASALLALVGVGAVIGPLFRGASLVLGRVRERPAVVWAASQLRRPTGRHRLAAAGLVAAVGMAAGMAILVASFDKTLTGWIGDVLEADLYVATPGAGNASNTNTIRAATWQAVAGEPGVESVDLMRRYTVDFQGRPVRLSGSQNRLSLPGSSLGNQPPAGTHSGVSLTWSGEGPVPASVNEPFSRRFGLRKGDGLEMEVPGGIATLQIRSVYPDYSDEWGTILVDRHVTEKWFGDTSVTSMGLHLKPGVDPGQVRARLAGRFPALVVRSNRHLREEAMRVFHRTFAVTHALEAIGVAVAVAGLGLTLASLLLERRGEMLTLKSLGITRRQVSRACAVEGMSLALVGTAGGLVLSVILGLLLVYVINRQSFGWTLEFCVPAGSLALLTLATLATSAIVAAAVGRWGARLRSEQVE